MSIGSGMVSWRDVIIIVIIIVWWNGRYRERTQTITTRHQMYHVYPLDTEQKDWDIIIAEARKALKID